MSEGIYVLGAGQSHYGKFYDRNTKSLAEEAVRQALEQAGVSTRDIQAVWVGSAVQGILTGQEMIRGQAALVPLGISGVPITNVENACASASTAFHSAWTAIKAGLYECVLALGMEKMAFNDPVMRAKAMESFSAAVDIEDLDWMRAEQQAVEAALAAAGRKSAYGEGRAKSLFMDIYAAKARDHMERYGTRQLDLALVASKNHKHASLNPYAQYRKEVSPEEVLSDDLVSYPITRLMCAPLGDGAAATVICSESFLKRLEHAMPVEVLASCLTAGAEAPTDGKMPSDRLIAKAYATAGLGPQDISVAEVHDATAFSEIVQVEALGFCEPGEGGAFSASGATTLGGRIPVNPSGGLESRGHPIGATGLAQITEIVWQLQGQCGKRQVENARIGLTQNSGGNLRGGASAAYTVHLFGRAF